MLFKIKLVYNFSTDASPSPTFFNLALYSNDFKTTLVFGMGRHFQLGATPLYRLPCPVNPRLIQTWLQEKCAKKPHWPISITQHTHSLFLLQEHRRRLLTYAAYILYRSMAESMEGLIKAGQAIWRNKL